MTPLKMLLLEDAKETLCNAILNNRVKAIEWINEKQMRTLSTKEKVEYLRFFLQHENFKEHQFFFWKLEGLDHIFSKPVTQKEALHLVLNERKEKNVKKALYQGYNDAMKKQNTIIHIAIMSFQERLIILICLQNFMPSTLSSNRTFLYPIHCQ